MKIPLMFAAVLIAMLSVSDPGLGDMPPCPVCRDGEVVVASWVEATAHSGVQVRGRRLFDFATNIYRDIYTDMDGNRLGAGDMAALRIVPKNWAESDWAVDLEIPDGEPPISGVKRLPPRRRAISSELIELPTVDVAALLEEDRGDDLAIKGVLRTGVVQALEWEVFVAAGESTEGEWGISVSGERIWSLTIWSPGAIGQRVHFLDLELPEGVELFVYDALDPQELYGPIRDAEPDVEDLWTPTCFSEFVSIECVVPASADWDPLFFSIDRIVHVYTDFRATESSKAAGTCNLDVSCSPEWGGEALAVGGLGWVGSEGSLFCTGSLLADADPDTELPFLVTASHCVDSASKANTTELYWFYQTGICGGAVPALEALPRTTGGADLLVSTASYTDTDFTLLRLREDPPDGVAYLGWTSLRPDVGVEVVGIHHPRGEFKRIVFGAINSQDRFDSPYSAKTEILWTDGTTEPGSSGSPLLLADSGLFIGQLFGGTASCSKPSEPDYYGRFNQSLPLAAPWLVPTHEPWDVDYSGEVDLQDLQLAASGSIGKQVGHDTDVNATGSTDATDVQLVALALSGEMAGAP